MIDPPKVLSSSTLSGFPKISMVPPAVTFASTYSFELTKAFPPAKTLTSVCCEVRSFAWYSPPERTVASWLGAFPVTHILPPVIALASKFLASTAIRNGHLLATSIRDTYCSMCCLPIPLHPHWHLSYLILRYNVALR